MISEIADFIADQVESTERYFMDTYLKHVYKFQVSILRVPLIKEVTGKVQKFKNSQTDDSSDTFDPLSKTEKQVLIDDAFSLAGDYDTVIKESVEDGIRRTFINKTMVQGLVDGYGTTKIKRADGTEFPRIKQLNKDSLVIQYEAGQITEKRVTGQAEFFEDNPTRKGRTQMIVNRLTNDLLYEARSVAFDLINEKVFATKELKRGGWGDSATVRRNEPAIKGHGDLKGNLSGTKVQPVGKKQTTVAVISLAKNWKTIAGNRKAKFEKNYMQEVLDAHDEVYTRIEGQLDAIFEINRFQDYVTKPEMYEKLDVNLHATDQKGNAAMGSFDVQGIKDTLKNRIADKVLADITKGISKKSKKYLEMKGSISKKKALEKMAKKAIIQSLIKQKVGVKPDFRLKVNKRLVAKGGKLPKGKKGKASFAIAAKTKKKSGRKKARAGGFGKVKKTGRRGPEAKTAQSPIALRNLLNELLPTAVAQNMGSPALNYRTGRFANSARVEMVHQGARGGTQIDYTYMKYPYQTFEPGFKQGSTMRDPRKIIGESIRELATGILGRQPHTIRRT